MTVELTEMDIEVIIEALKYGKLNIEEAKDTPYSVRKENLARIESVIKKFSVAELKTQES